MTDLNRRIGDLRDELIHAVQESVRINSVEDDPQPGMPFGPGAAAALEHALRLADQLGFKTVNLDGYAGYAEYGDGEDYVAVLGHLDVVPAGGGWDYPPFGAEIHDGKIYGRGTMDDKGPTFAALYGLKAIKDLGLPLTKKVRLIFGIDEETGSQDMKYYSKKEKPPVAGFTPDAEFPVIFGEKGIAHFTLVKEVNEQQGPVRLLSITGGERPNIVPNLCEAVLETSEPERVIRAAEEFAQRTGAQITAATQEGRVLLRSRGVAAHASLPHLGKNAIMQLLAFLGALELTGTVREFVAGVNELIGMEIHGQSMGIGFTDEPSGSLTLNAGMINLENNRIKLVCDVRFPVTYKSPQIIEPIKQKVAEKGLALEDLSAHDPLYFPKDHPLIKTLHRVFVEQTGFTAAPLAIGGGTYAKSIPNIVAFGPQFPGEPELAHQANEYISIERLVQMAKIYAQAIHELAK